MLLCYSGFVIQNNYRYFKGNPEVWLSCKAWLSIRRVFAVQVWSRLITSTLTTICFGAQVLPTTVQGPFEIWRRGGWGGVPKHGRGKVAVEVVQHLAAVPGPAYAGMLVVTGRHAQRRPVPFGADVPRGHAQAQRGAQVEQATPGHPLPALAVFLTGGWQNEGVIPHSQAPLGALIEERKVVRVQRRCAEREKVTMASGR